MTTRRTTCSVAFTRTTAPRLRRAVVEAGVVACLTVAIMAVLCLFGMQRASAAGMEAIASGDGRIAIGAVLLAGFVGLCGLTSFMLRDTMQPARAERKGRRQG